MFSREVLHCEFVIRRVKCHNGFQAGAYGAESVVYMGRQRVFPLQCPLQWSFISGWNMRNSIPHVSRLEGTVFDIFVMSVGLGSPKGNFNYNYIIDLYQ